jgi:hypothetical protein
MSINRNNYEEFFMLYADNELSAAQRKQVEEFVAGNPDLKHELELFQQFKLSPDTRVVFENKAALLKQEGLGGIAMDNYESYFVLYADSELSNVEKAEVADFVYRHPSLQDEFELLQKARLSADNRIVFENKEALYRHEKDEKVIPFRWWRIAVAAAVLLFVSGLLWINDGKKDDGRQMAINSNPEKPVKRPTRPGITDPVTENKVGKEQSTAKTIAVTYSKQPNGQEKNARPVRPGTAVAQNKIKNRPGNISDPPNVIQTEPDGKETDGMMADNGIRSITSTAIEPIQQKSSNAEIKRPLIAAAKEPIIDQPAVILNPDENKTKVQYASLNNDNVEVLNTTVNTKNALRGFIRKASRMIAKKTDTGEDDGRRKGILIGGFEIAVR